MKEIIIPSGYKTKLGTYDTQRAIGMLKKSFEKNLCKRLHLKRVSAPLFVLADSGLNDNLNGVERPVNFDIKETNDFAEVVHSLAKWKRLALAKYDFFPGKGLYTDMNAIRRDEEMDNLHSIYVDQWDWEKVITKETRNLEYLKNTVRDIVYAIYDTNEEMKNEYPVLDFKMNREVKFITTQEAEDLYPNYTSKEREDALAKQYGTIFLMQIGDKLKSGEKHDGRAPDYDDWALNGDIILWNEVLGRSFEISSMGIRVNKESLKSQVLKAGCPERLELPFHKMILNDEVPLTIGGGIGQSRLSMLILQKAHVGEVQCSIWDKENLDKCKEAGIELL